MSMKINDFRFISNQKYEKSAIALEKKLAEEKRWLEYQLWLYSWKLAKMIVFKSF